MCIDRIRRAVVSAGEEGRKGALSTTARAWPGDLGAGRLLEAALWTAGAGGLLALGVLGYRALRRKFAGVPLITGSPEQKLEQESIPYAPAIALGVWLSLVPKG